MGSGDLRGGSDGWFALPVGLRRAVVLEPETLQRV